MKKTCFSPVFFPLCCGITVMIFLHIIKVQDTEIPKIDFVMNAVITCAVTLAGFILTSISIIVGMSGSPIMKKISKDGGLPEIIARYTTTMVLSLLLIIIFIVIGATIKGNNIVSKNCIIIGAGIIFAYLFSLLSTCYYLFKIISQIPDSNHVEVIEEPSVPKGEFR